jgi:MFS family permease
MAQPAARLAPAALALFALQFLLVCSWTIYVAFLPQLAERAGIAASWIAAILILDQVLFALGDFTAGVATDTAARNVARFGRRLAVVGLASAAAFLLLPQATSPLLFMALIVIWTLCSSALRAPVMALVSKHAPAPSVPLLASMSLFGLGVAGALAPYLGARLRGVDPALPFVLSSLVLAAATLVLLKADVLFGDARPAETREAGAVAPSIKARASLLLALLLAAAAFQVHFFVASAPAYLRFAGKEALEQLMPVFWIGFNLSILPVGFVCKRLGEIRVMVAGAALAAAGAVFAAQAPSLALLVGCQLLAGAGWAFMLLAALTAAVELGRTGFEGRMTGLFFGLLAVATLARIAAVAAQLPKAPAIAPLLADMPWLLWGASALVLLATRMPARARA